MHKQVAKDTRCDKTRPTNNNKLKHTVGGKSNK